MAFYYDRISVREDIDLESYENNDNLLNETISKRCTGCWLIFYNKVNFKHQERRCDRCFIMLLGTGLKPRSIMVIWWNNSRYRVLTTLRHHQAFKLMGIENPTDRYGYVNNNSLEN